MGSCSEEFVEEFLEEKKIRNEKGCSIDEYFREVFNVS